MPRPQATPSTPIKLERGERLIYTAHRHWVDLARRAILPFILWAVVSLIFLMRLPSAAFDRTQLLLFIVGSLLFVSLIYIYLDWRDDVLYVTNKRVIFIDRVFLISSKRDELLMDSIENVNIETESVIARQLGYGHVLVQTASRMRNIRFAMAQKPEEILGVIMSQVLPIRTGLAQERVRQVVRARVLGGQQEPPPPAPVHLLPKDFFGKGFAFIFPANPRQDGDSVIWHKHWIVGFTSLLDPVLLLAILVVGRSVLASTGFAIGLIGSIIFILAIIAVIGWIIYRWLDWIDDHYILSPNDVVDIERHPLGKEDRRQASLAAIQNVTSSQPNILARLLNYGDVFLQTAGGQGEFSFYHVPAPDKVQAVIFDYLDSFKRRQQEKERFDVLDLIRHYHVLENGEGGEKQG